MVDGYGEWVQHPLFGLRARSFVGVYKQRRRRGEEASGMEKHAFATAMTDWEKGIVLWWPTSRLGPLYPPLMRDKSSILHFVACASWHPSHIHVSLVYYVKTLHHSPKILRDNRTGWRLHTCRFFEPRSKPTDTHTTSYILIFMFSSVDTGLLYLFHPSRTCIWMPWTRSFFL